MLLVYGIYPVFKNEVATGLLTLTQSEPGSLFSTAAMFPSCSFASAQWCSTDVKRFCGDFVKCRKPVNSNYRIMKHIVLLIMHIIKDCLYFIPLCYAGLLKGLEASSLFTSNVDWL